MKQVATLLIYFWCACFD